MGPLFEEEDTMRALFILISFRLVCGFVPYSNIIGTALYEEPVLNHQPAVEPSSLARIEYDIVESTAIQDKLFSFRDDGTEVNDLLPPLSRRLDLGIGCYYEESDRPVVRLVRRTRVHPIDACWALEACRGDQKEAWLCISVAKKLKQVSNEKKQFNVDSYEAVPLEWAFSRHVKTKRVKKKPKKGAVLIRLAILLAVCRGIFGSGVKPLL